MIKLCGFLLLLSAVSFVNAEWNWTGIKNVTRFQHDSFASNGISLSADNNQIIMDDNGNSIVGYTRQYQGTINLSRCVYQVKSPLESEFSECQVVGETESAFLKFVKSGNQIKAFYLADELGKYPLYICTWNPASKTFDNHIKIGLNVKSGAFVDYMKHNDIEYITVCNKRTGFYNDDTRIVLKINNGSGWNADSLIVCSKGSYPTLGLQDSNVQIFYLANYSTGITGTNCLERKSVINNILSEAQLLDEQNISAFNLLTIPDGSLRVVFKRSWCDVYIGKIESHLIAFNGKIESLTANFSSLFFDNKIHVVGEVFLANQIAHWFVNTDGDSIQEMSRFSFGDAGIDGFSAVNSTDNQLHISYYKKDLLSTVRPDIHYNSAGLSSDIATGEIPGNLALLYNYPNPFNNSTALNYRLRADSHVRLRVFNGQGQLVEELFNCRQTAGDHSATFNASGLNSGVYFYKLECNGKSLTNRMLMIK